jgi:hypothetical protein
LNDNLLKCLTRRRRRRRKRRTRRRKRSRRRRRERISEFKMRYTKQLE